MKNGEQIYVSPNLASDSHGQVSCSCVGPDKHHCQTLVFLCAFDVFCCL